MTPRMWFYTIVVGLILGVVLWITILRDELNSYMEYKKNAEGVATVTGVATEGVATATENQRQQIDIVTHIRDERNRAFEELKREDTNVRDWADTRIPDSVRDIDNTPIDRSQDNQSGRDGTSPAH